MPGFSLQQLRARLAGERGMALVATIGVLSSVSIIGASAIEYSAMNQRSAFRSSADHGAFAAAEAGLHNAAAILGNPLNNPADGTLLPERTTTLPTGTATWSGTYDRANAVWTITSRGTVRNPTGASDLHRSVTARVRVLPVPTRPLPNDAWDYLYTTQAGVGGVCDVTLSSSVVVTSPMFVTGNLCLSSSASVATGPLVVKGKVNLIASTASVGSVATPISTAHIGVGCKYASQHWHPDATDGHPFCSSGDRVYVQPGMLDQVVPAITPPVADAATLDRWYRAAAPGPFEPCTSATGTPPVFEDQIVSLLRNNSVLTPFSLTPPMSYSCRVGPADDPLGELSWDAVTRTLTVKGTIFIDGSAKVDNGLVNVYQGQGTVYLSGSFLVSTTSKLCARSTGTDCDFTGWDPRAPGAPMLTVVATGSAGQAGVPLTDSITLGSTTSFQGMLHATYMVGLGSSTQTQGPMVAYSIRFGSSVRTHNFPALDTAPTGAPGADFSYARAESMQDFGG